MPADQKTVRVQYRLDAERQEVHLTDALTGGTDVVFRRGEVKDLPAAAWVDRLLRRGPGFDAAHGFDAAALAACEFVEAHAGMPVGLHPTDPKFVPLPGSPATPTGQGDQAVASPAAPAAAGVS